MKSDGLALRTSVTPVSLMERSIKISNRRTEGGDLYFSRHGSKKFHDPFAAVAMLHPEIVTWIKGKIVKLEGGWSATREGDDFLAVDLDYDGFWNHIRSFT